MERVRNASKRFVDAGTVLKGLKAADENIFSIVGAERAEVFETPSTPAVDSMHRYGRGSNTDTPASGDDVLAEEAGAAEE